MDTTKAGGDVTRLVRPELLALLGYEPIEPVDVLAEELGIPPEQGLKLGGNEKPHGAAAPGDIPVPPFGVYSFATQVWGGRAVEVLRRQDFGLDLPAVRAASKGAKL